MKDYLIGLLLGILCMFLAIVVVDEIDDNKLCLKCQNEDVNRDGKVNIKDLLKVQKYIISNNEKEGENCYDK